MLSFLPAPVTAAIMLSILVGNTLFWASFVVLTALIKLCCAPWPRLRKQATRLVVWVCYSWNLINVLAVNYLLPTRLNLHCDDMSAVTRKEGVYLMTSNHQSWVDIIIIMNRLLRQAPFPAFFLKQELIYIPVLGLAWWALDFPFMKRYSKEQIAQNPALANKDLEATRKLCDRYQDSSVTIINFLEGTRLTTAKHQHSNNLYQYLLPPKTGGIALVIGSMGQVIKKLLNVTVHYPGYAPGKAPGMWDFLGGKVKQVDMYMRVEDIPAHLIGADYSNDVAAKQAFQDWTTQLWKEKDQLLKKLNQQQ